MVPVHNQACKIPLHETSLFAVLQWNLETFSLNRLGTLPEVANDKSSFNIFKVHRIYALQI